MKLVYHKKNGSEVSDFDTSIMSVAAGDSIGIISPYISIDYLIRIIGVAENWLLISDVEEWLSSTRPRDLKKVSVFISKYHDRIHHYPKIHAKSVIGKRKSFIGSSNLTASGVLGRTEIGALIDEPDALLELGAWFDDLWANSHPPAVEEVANYVDWLKSSKSTADSKKSFISSDVQGVSKKLSGISPEFAGGAWSLASSLESYLLSVPTDLIDGRCFHEIFKLNGCGDLRGFYLSLVSRCVNHFRGVFSVADKSLVIIRGHNFYIFNAATASSDDFSIFDNYLYRLTLYFSFDSKKPWPSFQTLSKLTGVREVWQKKLNADLLAGEFILRTIDNGIELFELNDGFEWGGHWVNFRKAHELWVSRLAEGGRSYSSAMNPVENFGVEPPPLNTSFQSGSDRQQNLSISSIEIQSNIDDSIVPDDFPVNGDIYDLDDYDEDDEFHVNLIPGLHHSFATNIECADFVFSKIANLLHNDGSWIMVKGSGLNFILSPIKFLREILINRSNDLRAEVVALILMGRVVGVLPLFVVNALWFYHKDVKFSLTRNIPYVVGLNILNIPVEYVSTRRSLSGLLTYRDTGYILSKERYLKICEEMVWLHDFRIRNMIAVIDPDNQCLIGDRTIDESSKFIPMNRDSFIVRVIFRNSNKRPKYDGIYDASERIFLNNVDEVYSRFISFAYHWCGSIFESSGSFERLFFQLMKSSGVEDSLEFHHVYYPKLFLFENISKGVVVFNDLLTTDDWRLIPKTKEVIDSIGSDNCLWLSSFLGGLSGCDWHPVVGSETVPAQS